jgi:capsule polysaccharide export protein KpsE/RkpR
MDALKRLQKLSLAKRKVVFWIVMVIIGLIFLVIFIFLSANRLKNFQINNLREDINSSSFETENLFVPTPLDIGGE